MSLTPSSTLTPSGVLVPGQVAPGQAPRSYYRPPVIQEGWDPSHPLWRHYTARQGMSVVKRSGTWTAVRVLAHEEILDLTEGADYFVGGYVYEDVDPAILAELSAAGIGTIEE